MVASVDIPQQRPAKSCSAARFCQSPNSLGCRISCAIPGTESMWKLKVWKYVKTKSMKVCEN